MDKKEVVKYDNGLAVNMVTSRQAKEVEGMIYMAKKFPRDEFAASDKINKACRRASLAKAATYTYPRGNQTISGPSIRLAEAICQAWGNIDYGVIELSNANGLSEMMAYAWDLETNVRRTMIFSAKHVRETRNEQKVLTDTRDIYELPANLGARRVRACILGVIPADVVEEALATCHKTVMEGEGVNFDDSLKNMLLSFDRKFKVKREHIEDYIGYPIKDFDVNDLITIKGIYDSMKDGVGKREDYFNIKKEVIDPLAEVKDGEK